MLPHQNEYGDSKELSHANEIFFPVHDTARHVRQDSFGMYNEERMAIVSSSLDKYVFQAKQLIDTCFFASHVQTF